MVSLGPRPRSFWNATLWAGLLAMFFGAVLGVGLAMAIVHSIADDAPDVSEGVAPMLDASEGNPNMVCGVPYGS